MYYELGSRTPSRSYLDTLYMCYCDTCERFVQQVSNITYPDHGKHTNPPRLTIGTCNECKSKEE